MTFYLVTETSRLSAFSRKGDKFELEYIDGSPSIVYEPQKIKNAVKYLLDGLITNYNLNDGSELEFIVIESRDAIKNKVVLDMLNAAHSAFKVQTLDNLLKFAIGRLLKDKSLYVNEFGVNYDDSCFRLKEGRLQSDDFSLTAYTLPKENVLI